MAVEYRTLEIDNEDEEGYISIYLSFGWTLKSSQRIFDRNTRVSGSDSSYIYTTTDTVDFTKLVFERDKNMPHYTEIACMELDFWEIENNLPEKRPINPVLLDMEKWAEGKPYFFSKAESFLRGIPFFLLFPILVFAVYYSETSFSLSSLPKNIAITALMTAIPDYLIARVGLNLSNKIFWIRHRKGGVNSIPAKYQKMLKTEYEKYVARIRDQQAEYEAYEEKRKQMNALKRKASALL